MYCKKKKIIIIIIVIILEFNLHPRWDHYMQNILVQIFHDNHPHSTVYHLVQRMFLYQVQYHKYNTRNVQDAMFYPMLCKPDHDKIDRRKTLGNLDCCSRLAPRRTSSQVLSCPAKNGHFPLNQII